MEFNHFFNRSYFLIFKILIVQNNKKIVYSFINIEHKQLKHK